MFVFYNFGFDTYQSIYAEQFGSQENSSHSENTRYIDHITSFNFVEYALWLLIPEHKLYLIVDHPYAFNVSYCRENIVKKEVYCNKFGIYCYHL